MEITVSTQVKEREGDENEPLSSFSSEILLISEVSTPISPHEAFSDVSVIQIKPFFYSYNVLFIPLLLP